MRAVVVCALMWVGASARADEFNRGYIRVRPFAGVAPAGFRGEELVRPAGAIADGGVDAETRGNFRIGFEFAPLVITAERPQMTGRLTLGWASEKLAIGVGVGSGFTSAYAQ